MFRRSEHPQGSVLLVVGTKKGLFLISSVDRKSWNVQAPMLKGHRVFNGVLDQRGRPRLFAADNGDFFGTFLRYSDDFGESWHEPERGLQFPAESGQKLNAIWTIVPGRSTEPDVVYAGVDPASLWISTDGGVNWELNAGLATHPTRERWEPGAGGLCLHSIVPDYANAARMWVAISAVGCLRSDDAGKSWTFINKNVRAGFQPDIYPEFGQCVHRLIQHPDRPDVLYQQNHCGIYKSTNGGVDWTDIQQNLPSEFGFPIALDPHHPETLYVVVEEGETRQNVGAQFRVYRSENAGEHWEELTNGLPAGPGVGLGVLRHAMCTDVKDPCGVYVGTTTGQLFASNDRGEGWSLIADYLPPIYSVTAAVLT
jgi:BNR/Asp-box repeat